MFGDETLRRTGCVFCVHAQMRTTAHICEALLEIYFGRPHPCGTMGQRLDFLKDPSEFPLISLQQPNCRATQERNGKLWNEIRWTEQFSSQSK